MKNWYKKADIWEDIDIYGPNAKTDIEDPRQRKVLESIANKWNLSIDELIEKIKEFNPDSKRNPYFGDFHRRDFFTTEYGWSVPSKEAIEEIKKFVGGDKVVEVGSGHGLWAKLMQDAGIEINATDYFGGRGAYLVKKEPFTNVEDLTHDRAISKYGDYNVLMMSWPPLGSPMANETLNRFNGNKLIFIGEDQGGCTADDDFYSNLCENWKSVGSINIPQWYSVHDVLSFWKRN
jgi:hypothetical protein